MKFKDLYNHLIVEDKAEDYDRTHNIDIEARNKSFQKMADAQRAGDPEKFGFQSRTLEPLTNGIYAVALEHVGDITHRLGENFKDRGGDSAHSKIKNDLRHIVNNKDWWRGIREQSISNAKYYISEYNRPIKVYLAEDIVRGYGAKYAEAHSTIPVYNEIQWLARQAAIDLGDFEFESCRENLVKIDKAIDDWDSFWLGNRYYDGKEYKKPDVSRERLNKRKALIEYYEYVKLSEKKKSSSIVTFDEFHDKIKQEDEHTVKIRGMVDELDKEISELEKMLKDAGGDEAKKIEKEIYKRKYRRAELEVHLK